MTTQIAVKLPEATVRRLDALVTDGVFENRSQAVRRALDVLVAAAERAAVDHAFAKGFASHPETPEELAEATRLAIESIEEEPWERWW